MIYAVLLGFLINLYFQVKNLIHFYYEGNGANTQRFSLIIGTLTGITISIGVIVKSFGMISVAITIGLLSRVILYWPMVADFLKNALSKFK